VSGYADEDGYALTLTALDAGGAPLATAVHAVTIAAGGGAAAAWLDIPAQATFANDNYPPGPSGSIGQFTLALPTNASGSTYYTINLATRADNQLSWRNWNNLTRTISWDQMVKTTSLSDLPDVFVFEVTDDAGNYGIGYHLFAYFSNVTTRMIARPEIVLEENDPPYSLTYAPWASGATGSNDPTIPIYILGSGKVTGAQSVAQQVSTLVYQGPFTVDPTPGGVVFMYTMQEFASTDPATHWIVQPIRRRRATGTKTGKFLRNYELDVTQLQTTGITMPVTGTPSTSANTPPGNPSYYDIVMVRASVLAAGSASTSEQANAVSGTGLVTELVTTASNTRGIGSTLTAATYNGTNTSRKPVYSSAIPVSDEVVFRMMGRIDMTNASSSNTAFVDWCAVNATNTIGAIGLRFRLNQGMTTGFVPNNYVTVSCWGNPSFQRQRAQIPRTVLLSQDIGMDVYLRGAGAMIALYVWPGSFPDLSTRIPYAGIRHWTFDWARGDMLSQITGSEPDFVGANTHPWQQSPRHGRNYMQDAQWGAYVTAGNSGAVTIRSEIKRVAIEHRPRTIILGV